MSQRQIFKVAILSHDEPLFQELFPIFGIDFEKAMTETSGASFSYSHFHVEDGQRLTAQFWMLEASPQWASIRTLYFKGASGIILLHDPTTKNSDALNNRLIREFVSTNRFQVPIIVINMSKKNNLAKTKSYAKDIERWCGYSVPVISKETDEIQSILNRFMIDVRDWRARNVIFQTLKLYFNLDAINHQKRSISKIISQLRQIYTSGYYELINDQQIFEIVQQAILLEGFKYDPEAKCILYEKEITKNPWSHLEAKIGPSEFNKPSVEKLD